MSNRHAETIVIFDPAHNALEEYPSNRIMSQETNKVHKYWHFKFISQSDEDAFTAMLKTAINPTINVIYNYDAVKKADVTIMNGASRIGCIHFLKCDRRDFNNPDKHYIKLHLYNFIDVTHFNAVKDAIIPFFNHIQSNTYQNSMTQNSMTQNSLKANHTKKNNTIESLKKRLIEVRKIIKNKTNKINRITKNRLNNSFKKLN
jgi:hypothetical protein